MAVSAGISNALERNWSMVDCAIDGLSDETLVRWTPKFGQVAKRESRS